MRRTIAFWNIILWLILHILASIFMSFLQIYHFIYALLKSIFTSLTIHICVMLCYFVCTWCLTYKKKTSHKFWVIFFLHFGFSLTFLSIFPFLDLLESCFLNIVERILTMLKIFLDPLLKDNFKDPYLF